jgi:hypothetical protein
VARFTSATASDFGLLWDFADRCAACAAAAVFGEEGDEGIHSTEMRCVNELTAPPLLSDEPCSHEVVEMKRERGARDVERLSDGSGSQPFRASLHQEAVDAEACLLCQRPEPLYGFARFHPSTILDLSKQHSNIFGPHGGTAIGIRNRWNGRYGEFQFP